MFKGERVRRQLRCSFAVDAACRGSNAASALYVHRRSAGRFDATASDALLRPP